jgi:plastocyanin
VITNPSFRVPSRVCTGLLFGAVALLPIARPPLQALAPSRLTGTVALTTAIKAPLPSAAYASRRADVPAVDAMPEMANVVIYVKGASYGGPLPQAHGRIVQQDESFMPRLVAVTRGSTVDFPNADPYFHDVFSLSRVASFDLGSYPRGSSRSWRFTKAGLVKVFCHLHSHMHASIMVFDHPYFTIPSADGTFAIDGLPEGDYDVVAWHERIGESARKVHFEAGRTSEVRFSLPVVE